MRGIMSRIIFASFASADAARANIYIAALRAAGLDVRVPADTQALDIAQGIPSMFLLLASEAVLHDEQVMVLLNHYQMLWQQAGAERFETNPYLLLPFYLTYFPGLESLRFTSARGIIYRNYAERFRDRVFHRDIEVITDLAALPHWEPMAIPERLEQLGYTGWQTHFKGWRLAGTTFILPPMCRVPAGLCLLGSDPTIDPLAYSNETPPCRFDVGAFRISAYPVTVAEYACYLASEKRRMNEEQSRYGGVRGSAGAGPEGGSGDINWEQQLEHPDHPVSCVSWAAARAYTEWLSDLTFQPWRLPTEIEWEKAARWDASAGHARIYPWGDVWEKNRANTNEGGPGQTTPVGAYSVAGDSSPYGLHDVVGNVYEWTSSLWDTTSSHAGIQEQPGDKEWYEMHVLRGGSWRDISQFARAAFRTGFSPYSAMGDSGFRIAR
jgi:formylglycine-generating enzyme required for sulfatase activity